MAGAKQKVKLTKPIWTNTVYLEAGTEVEVEVDAEGPWETEAEAAKKAANKGKEKDKPAVNESVVQVPPKEDKDKKDPNKPDQAPVGVRK